MLLESDMEGKTIKFLYKVENKGSMVYNKDKFKIRSGKIWKLRRY